MSGTMFVPLVFMAIVALVVVAKSVVLVPPGQQYVVGTLGKANRVLHSGLHILPPFVTTIVGKVPVSEQTVDVPETGARLTDGSGAAVRGTVRYSVTEPLLAINDVDDYQHAIAQLTATHWRTAIEASDAVNLRTALDTSIDPIRKAAARWGITVVDASLQVSLSEASVRDLERRAAIERQGRVLAWLAERDEQPADGGRPSPEQERAFDRWVHESVEAHREEIEAAQRAERPADTADPFVRPAADADGTFRGAAPNDVAFAVARSPIPPDGTGRVEADGREWAARNESTIAIVAGFRCVVDRQDGDTLIVRPL